MLRYTKEDLGLDLPADQLSEKLNPMFRLSADFANGEISEEAYNEQKDKIDESLEKYIKY